MNIYIYKKNQEIEFKKATEGSSGYDLCAYNVVENNKPLFKEYKPSWVIDIDPMERVFVSTGIFLNIQNGYEGQIRPRSGLSCKKGLIIPNSPGTIDSDYRGEIIICLLNLSGKMQCISKGDRIAQIIFCEVLRSDIINVLCNTPEEFVDKFPTSRGIGGFGSTGV